MEQFLNFVDLKSRQSFLFVSILPYNLLDVLNSEDEDNENNEGGGGDNLHNGMIMLIETKVIMKSRQ